MSHAVEIVEPSIIELAPDQNYKPRWMYSTLPSGAGPTSKLSEEKITPLMSGLFEIVKLLSCSWSSYSYMFLSITKDVNFTWVQTFYLGLYYTCRHTAQNDLFFLTVPTKTSSKRVLVSFKMNSRNSTCCTLGIHHGFWCLLAKTFGT